MNNVIVVAVSFQFTTNLTYKGVHLSKKTIILMPHQYAKPINFATKITYITYMILNKLLTILLLIQNKNHMILIERNELFFYFYYELKQKQ